MIPLDNAIISDWNREQIATEIMMIVTSAKQTEGLKSTGILVKKSPLLKYWS